MSIYTDGGLNLINIGVLLIELIVIIILLIRNIKLKSRNKSYKETLSKYKDKVREDNLDALITNEHYVVNKYLDDEKQMPYEIIFHEEKQVEHQNVICVHIEHESEIANRKYIINIKDEMYVGKKQGNAIVINEVNIADKHFRLFKKDNELYIQKLAEQSIKLKRKKNIYELNESPVKINSGDIIKFEKSEFTINLF